MTHLQHKQKKKKKTWKYEIYIVQLYYNIKFIYTIWRTSEKKTVGPVKRKWNYKLFFLLLLLPSSFLLLEMIRKFLRCLKFLLFWLGYYFFLFGGDWFVLHSFYGFLQLTSTLGLAPYILQSFFILMLVGAIEGVC